MKQSTPHLGGEFHAPAIPLYVPEFPVVGGPNGGEDRHRHARVFTYPFEAAGGTEPVEGEAPFPAVPSCFPQGNQGRLEIRKLPPERTVGHGERHCSLLVTRSRTGSYQRCAEV